MEHVIVHEHERERRHRHSLRDSTEIEHALVLQESQIIQRVHRVAQNIHHHPAESPKRLLLVAGRIHVRHLLEAWFAPANFAIQFTAPDLPRPEEPPFVDVFAEVSDDVRLLQHGAHRIAKFKLLAEPG